MKNILIIFMMLWIVPIIAQEESLPKSSTTVKYYDSNVPNELHNMIGDFFKTIIRGDITDGYKQLLKNSPLLSKDEELARLVEQTQRAERLYGQLKGFEPVDAEVASNSLIKCRYLGLYSKYPLRWIFTFYKSPETGWTVTNIKFDDQSDYYFRGD